MTDNKTSTKEQRYIERMQRKKQIIDEKIAQATEERGVLLIHTGNGKGKSSSAFGMVARALGHEMKVGVVQFIKGSFSTGEEAFFKRFDEVDYHVMGDGFTWETQNPEQDKQSAVAAWEVAAKMLDDDSYHLVVLDEVNIAIKGGLLSLDTVLTDLQSRPVMQHVVLTGRGAKDELIEIADTVTEMRDIKHAFRAGIKAQKGVEL
ncbi:MAG: cob(I)yrinic acid a,c-diamide adenosyltransferase [Gammaproteobacteria bacterium]|nr:cob(I)yrinic acid a,c-diamide adenosyltransferase [Gammaproteobacteria bacterium]